MKTKRFLSLMLTLCMLVTMLPGLGGIAHAAGNGKAIQLVTGGAAANITGAQASSVNFGMYPQSSDGSSGYNDDPIK